MLLKSTIYKKYQILSRYYHRKSVISSEEIRKCFLDYFIRDNRHVLIRSSPVVPFCDPTVPFVNAGMNQFKTILLGEREPKFLRAANSQKCIRVGGKHNDLEIVGLDGYHHTFFEMLGNWSFGDYFKEEACTLAWNLLTGPYKLNSSRLYVTYFGGDAKYNLLPDDETKDIWRRLGVPSDHIIPFGMGDNFWEMGFTGPCGPCSEIHIDHTNSLQNRSADVNKGLSDLTELWNIVFIQYNRNSDGTIATLPKHHVDTGMGLERLTAILQNKPDNYETDLFQPIFDGIQKYVKTCPAYNSKFGKDDISGLDTSYRIAADHSRMITACLADGIIPEENYKLRRIIRKVISIGDKVFRKEKDFVWNVCKLVIEKLGPIYPEMVTKQTQIKSILSYEEEVFKSLNNEKDSNWLKLIDKYPQLNKMEIDAVSGFVLAYNEIFSLVTNKKITNIIPNSLAIKLYDSYGLDREKISEIATIFKLTFDINGFEQQLQDLRLRSKQSYIKGSGEEKIEKAIEILIEKNIPKTNDHAKYLYEFNENKYKFQAVEAKVVGILKEGTLHNDLKIEKNDEIFLIFDKTNLYTESGGQENDRGKVVFSNDTFLVENIINIKGYILHKIRLISSSSSRVQINEKALIHVDEEHRLNNMRNHTATHLINAAIKQIFHDLITCQKSSRVSATELKFDFNVFGGRLDIESIRRIEELINKIITLNKPTITQIGDSSQIYNDPDIVLVPGETYPDSDIRLVEIPVNELNFLSKEACCGTHVLNTTDLEQFVITNFKMNGRAAYTIKAATGPQSKEILQRGEEIENSVNHLCDPALLKEFKHLSELTEDVKKMIIDLNGEYLTNNLPFIVRSNCLSQLNTFAKLIKTKGRENLRLSVDEEVEELVESIKLTGKKWLVHNLQTVNSNDPISLSKITRSFTNTPIIVIQYANGQVKARCCVPKGYTTESFNANLWLEKTVAKTFNCLVAPPKGQDPLLVSNMKSRKIDEDKWEKLLEQAQHYANTYAQNNMDTKNSAKKNHK